MSKVAIVTGSSRGIGKSIAHYLAKNGFTVVVNSKNQNDASEVAKELQENFKIKSVGIAADIRNQNDVQKLINQTIEQFHQIDVLVNNAGVLIVKSLQETTEKEWNYAIDTNLKGTFLCSKEVLPFMLSKRSGCIININSGAGKSGFVELSAYCASKFGVIGITQSLAKEVDQYGITVISVCPGAVATDMQKQFMSEEEYEHRKQYMISPENVAQITLEAVDGKYENGSAVDVH